MDALSAAAGVKERPGKKILRKAVESLDAHLPTHNHSYLRGLLDGLQYALGELDVDDLFPDSERHDRQG